MVTQLKYSWVLIWSCLISNGGCWAVDEPKTASKKVQNAPNQQSLQTVIKSIEERLRNLDNLYSMQYSATLEGKLDQYARKLDSLETKISRLEAVMHLEMDKISENISGKNFKDNLIKDYLSRKIDSVYDRISHGFVFVELQMETTGKKLQDKIDLVIARQQKMEEGLLTRDADIQLEISDTIAAIDDTKTSCGIVEDQLKNVSKIITQSFAKSNAAMEILFTNKLKDLQENVTTHISVLEDQLYEHLDHLNKSTKVVFDVKEQLQEELNDYGNKISNMYETLWEKNKDVEKTVTTSAVVQNLTRNELQNGLRALMVQVGKKPVKSTGAEDTMLDQARLDELAERIESNFETIKFTQNAFLESCHRVQSDESQLESKISAVLEKLIDIFEERTSAEKKDMKILEQLIKSHDGNVRRSNYQLSSNLITLMDKTEDNRKRSESAVKSLQSQLNDMVLLIQDTANALDQQHIKEILAKLQYIVGSVNDINYKLHLYKPKNTTNMVLEELQSVKNILSENNNVNEGQLNKIIDDLLKLSDTVKNLNVKVSEQYEETSKQPSTVHANTSGEIVYPDEHTPHENATTTPTFSKELIDLVREVFGVEPYEQAPQSTTTESSLNVTNNQGGDIIFEDVEYNCTQSTNCTKNGLIYDIDVRITHDDADSNISKPLETLTLGQIQQTDIENVDDSKTAQTTESASLDTITPSVGAKIKQNLNDGYNIDNGNNDMNSKTLQIVDLQRKTVEDHAGDTNKQTTTENNAKFETIT